MDQSTIWKILETYFNDNPQALVRHHIDSYNDFYKTGIYQIFKEKNPIRLYSRPDPQHPGEFLSQCNLYMGGKNGDKIYFGKPVINDDENAHFMFPNEARLRNMTYGMTIHYDIEVEIIDKLKEGESVQIGGLGENDDNDDNMYSKPLVNYKLGEGLFNVEQPVSQVGSGKTDMTPSAAAQRRENAEQSIVGRTRTTLETINKVYLGKFPIMLQSDFCILQGLPREVRHTMGECRNDIGGYFIIDGKEKTVITQEKFADNMLYVHHVGNDKYTYVAEILSVSEDVSKPVRRLSVGICAPTGRFTNGNIVVNIPNVRKPVPLFIVFRALGIVSDKAIIEHCLLDMEKNEMLVDLFIPSVHDSATIMTQTNALQYIMLLIKKGSSTAQVLHILSDYFLPHVGETNYITKAYTLGWMVHRLLAVSQGLEPATDRDHFKCKRLEPVGELLSNLFREYWNLQLRKVHVDFESRLYFSEGMYENDLLGLIMQNYREVFKERILETGFRKAFKGNWGAQTHTKRVGVVQDLNRLSFNSALNHLRKTNLPLPNGVKLVGPRVLHNSQWGFLDPLDTPDGGSIGLHKHLSISTYITRGTSREPIIEWLREKWGMKFVQEFSPTILSKMTKILVNGYWVGAVDQPIECMEKFRLYRRNALLPIYMSCTFDIDRNMISIYTDAGRVCRPVFYRDEMTGRMSYQNKEILKSLQGGDFTWEQLVTGFNKKRENVKFDLTAMKIYELSELYDSIPDHETNPAKIERFLTDKSILDYIDANECESAYIALNTHDFETKNQVGVKYTHSEIHNSLILGMMGNMIIFPENNPAVRNSFSCGQSKQAVSVYHTNYQSRMDKASVVLSYGQIPLVKSRFLDFITKEENSYGENTIVAIACYTGYNVEDAILINEASLKRGLFRTSYFTTYEAHEETTKNADTMTEKRFMNIENEESVLGIKPGYDYSKLDSFGLIKEGTLVDDKTILIGMATVSGNSSVAQALYSDQSKAPKKGQLGVVDRAFITDGEEGQRIAKVRILETRIPTMGDKMASRAGQKGTIGLVIPERDMPFTSEGIRPDIIINPHAIPTRMTIGQLVECITGKVCAELGGFGDCTAFNNLGSKVGVFGQILPKMGYHSSGSEILYNGMTGQQMETEIFMGPTYYMRLKQLVKDKINYRARGPNTALTRQPVSGRANDGGLRIGEMEKDSVVSHGMTDFLRESMMERGDKYYFAVCNKTGIISVYNPSRGLFMSPMADGPLRFTGSFENDNLRVEHITKFGRDFSVICAPYSLKLLIHELQAMNVQMRIITEDNIEQLENMSYSNTMDHLTHVKDVKPRSLFAAIKLNIREAEIKKQQSKNRQGQREEPKHERFSKMYGDLKQTYNEDSPQYPDDVSPAFVPEYDEEYLGESPGYYPYSPDEPRFSPHSPDEPPPRFSPRSPDEPPPRFSPHSPDEPPPTNQEGGRKRRNSEDEDQDDDAYDQNDQLKVGELCYLRGTGQMPWKITHIGDKFASVNNNNPNDQNGIRIVSVSDLLSPNNIPQLDSSFYEPIHLQEQMQMQMQDPMHQQMQEPSPYYGEKPPIVVNFSPKIITNGNDQSTNQEPESGSVQMIPSMQMESSMMKPSIKTNTNEPMNSTPDVEHDFNQPMIVVKKG